MEKENNSEKIRVDICLGTTCFVMGAAKLQELENLLPKELKENVDIYAHTCLGLCQNTEFMQAPFVKVNGKILDKATVEKVIEKIKEVNA